MPETPEPTPKPKPAADGALNDGGKKALDTERKARREAETQLRAARERIAALELVDLRAEVASAKGLSSEQADVLAGSTREELEAHADRVLDAFKPAPSGPPSRRPKPDLYAGMDPTEDIEPDASALADRILSRGL